MRLAGIPIREPRIPAFGPNTENLEDQAFQLLGDDALSQTVLHSSNVKHPRQQPNLDYLVCPPRNEQGE